MNIQMFTIHDVKAGAYLPPFTLPTKQMAQRTFSDTVNDPKHPFNAHPEDYTLFHIGEFDDDSGMVTNDEGKTAIANGLDLLIPVPPVNIDVKEIHKRIDDLASTFGETVYNLTHNEDK